MIRVCPHSDDQCVHGMSCAYTCATDEYDGSKNLMAMQNAARTPPAMSADHIGGASPAVTEVGKLIQAPLVEKLVEALKEARNYVASALTEAEFDADPDSIAGVKADLAAIDEAFAYHNATNMVAPVEAVAWRVRRRKEDAGFGRPQVFTTDDASEADMKQWRGNGYEVQPLYTHPAPIKPSGDTGELRERVARVIGDRKGHPKPWSEDYELADAILDLIQSERAG